MNTRTETWCGYSIRFVEMDGGEWYAVLKDICSALDLRVDKVVCRIDPDYLEKVKIPSVPNIIGVEYDTPLKVGSHPEDTTLIGGSPINGKHKYGYLSYVISEQGIYQALFHSRKLEARKFVKWVTDWLVFMRKGVGLQPYEALQMTDPKIMDELDHMIGFWDEEKGKFVHWKTGPGGDVMIEGEDY